MLDSPLKQGATSPALGWLGQLRVWRDSHRQFAKQSFGRLLEKPLATLVTLAMLAIAIALPTLLHISVQNVARWTSYTDAGLELTAYLHRLNNTPRNSSTAGAETQDSGRALVSRIRSMEGVKDVEFISPQAALLKLELIAGADSTEIINSLPENPLPAAIRIVVGKRAELAATANAIATQLNKLPEVDSVSFNLDWFRKAQAIVQLAERINIAASLLLSLGVVLVIGNTVRVAIESRRDEILVAKLVGATNAYARRPFLYLGVWLGAAGALLALAISSLSVLALTYYIEPLEEAYSTNISLQGLSLSAALLIFLASVSLGWLGAWVMCSNQISAIEPE